MEKCTPPIRLSRRTALASGLGLMLSASPSLGAVKVVRGSSKNREGEPPSRGSSGGVRVIRPNSQGSIDASNPVGAIADLLGANPTRKLLLDHAHTGEQLSITYWRDGELDTSAMAPVGWFLRDWRQARPSPLTVGLLDVLWAVQTGLAGEGDPPKLRVLSAYRTEKTNEVLRASGVPGVAKDSFHLRGMAADIHCPERLFATLSSTCAQVAPGGIGRYRQAGFIHLDTGPSRRWDG